MLAWGRLAAHANGTGWDEVAVFVLPIVVLAALQRRARRRRR